MVKLTAIRAKFSYLEATAEFICIFIMILGFFLFRLKPSILRIYYQNAKKMAHLSINVLEIVFLNDTLTTLIYNAAFAPN